MKRDWSKHENQQVTVNGVAENAKAGPLLLVDGTHSILLVGISDWTDDVVGKKVQVEAIVKRQPGFPAMDEADEEAMQGTASGGDQWVLQVTSFKITN